MKQKLFRILSLLACWWALSSSGLAIITGPSAITYVDSAGHQRIYCFAIGDNGHLVMNYWDGYSWRWADQGKPLNFSSLETPSAITFKDVTGHQRIYVFLTGDNGNLVVNYWDGFAWHWADQGKQLPFADAITYGDRGGNRQIWVFGGNPGTGGLRANHWDGFSWQWADLGKPNGFSVIDPSAITYLDAAGTRRIYAFVNSGSLMFDHWNGYSWTWKDLGMPFGVTWTNVPYAITFKNASGDQEIYAFTHGSNGHAYMVGRDGSRGSTWDWVDLGLPSGLTSVWVSSAITIPDAAGNNRIYVFGTGNGRLVVKYWDGVKWRWADRGHPSGRTVFGRVDTIAYVDSAGQRRPYVFAVASGHLVANYFNGFRWAWSDHGTR
jgi:hypothetical protein